MNLELKQSTADNLKVFSDILQKDVSTILEEALEEYFAVQQQKLAKKAHDDEDAMTNLDYDEFWNGVEL